MTDVEQILTLECCCERKRHFQFRTELDTGESKYLIDRLITCPSCENDCRLTIEADAMLLKMLSKNRGNGLNNKNSPRRRRALRNRVFPTTEPTENFA
uniref:Uncharacterized protein n=1 Tax=Candidatus Kentrum sp. TUN TaxID=2126343 RepID=A0A451A464_9GAMM|nr:MAG: hypothetical protein BECKTUN1418F_GA0071002_12313 [Candidatus Kentron sp. TUN]VFK64245.1 MAG: hypothetical protein BECKTUN1418D_GA0071000_12522 [Candidatus Kentron sp. TUN]VFK70159.1 MAG: hypothetical protein BECKTUN1418E_GA0071001_12403 [Candidatus Kentron sp. TUN]